MGFYVQSHILVRRFASFLFSFAGRSSLTVVLGTTPFVPPSIDSQRSTPQPETDESPQQDGQVTQRSRWQAMLLEAGGLSAALSEENMRRLKYCLHWLQVTRFFFSPAYLLLMASLQYATAHIDAQILILRDFIATLQPLPSSPTHRRTNSNTVSSAHMRTLTDVRKDVIHTIRQVVDVVSKYAGGAFVFKRPAFPFGWRQPGPSS